MHGVGLRLQYFFYLRGRGGGWQVWCLWLLVFETPPCGRVWKKMGELGFMLSVERERERESGHA